MDVTLNNGVKLPSVGFGTFQLLSPNVEGICEAAINDGYRLIDTAAVYRNETHIAQVLKKFIPKYMERSNLFITTKLSPSSQGTERSKAAALSSLQSLELDYVDLYLIHWPGASGKKSDDSSNYSLRKESWLQLEKMYHQGKFRALGVSNYTLTHLKELLEYSSVVPAVLQIEVHPYLCQEELRNFCDENGIHVQAYSSLGSRAGCSELLHDPTVVEIAKELGRSSAQVVLRWAVQQGMSVIPKTSSVHRLKENLSIFDFTLTDHHLMQLNKLDKGKHYCWNPEDIK